MIQNYKIVTLRGSTRFKDQFPETRKRLTSGSGNGICKALIEKYDPAGFQ